MPRTTPPSIRPTNTCFDDALDFLEALCQTPDMTIELLRQYVVVHGVCLHPPDHPKRDEPFAHAWVECGVRDSVLQGAIVDGEPTMYEMPFSLFWARFRPQKLTRYSVDEAIALNHQTGHYGPWNEDYTRFCKDGDAPIRQHESRFARKR